MRQVRELGDYLFEDGDDLIRVPGGFGCVEVEDLNAAERGEEADLKVLLEGGGEGGRARGLGVR